MDGRGGACAHVPPAGGCRGGGRQVLTKARKAQGNGSEAGAHHVVEAAVRPPSWRPCPHWEPRCLLVFCRSVAGAAVRFSLVCLSPGPWWRGSTQRVAACRGLEDAGWAAASLFVRQMGLKFLLVLRGSFSRKAEVR